MSKPPVHALGPFDEAERITGTPSNRDLLPADEQDNLGALVRRRSIQLGHGFGQLAKHLPFSMGYLAMLKGGHRRWSDMSDQAAEGLASYLQLPLEIIWGLARLSDQA